jgi:acyl transferase domain-containing protein
MGLEDALRLVAKRGRLMSGLPRGSMLSIRLGEPELRSRLPAGIDIAAVNSPRLCVAAGPSEALGAFAAELSADGIACKPLRTSHAFHSSAMDPIVGEFTEAVREAHLSPPEIPFVSTVTGDWIGADEATDPAYWGRHMRSTVLFSAAAKRLLDDPRRALIECGPRQTLATLALQQQPDRPGRVFSAMPDAAEGTDERVVAILALGSLWMHGAEIDWASVHRGEVRGRIPLPTYPFQRKRFWVEPGDLSSFGLGGASVPKPGAAAADPEERKAGAAASADGDPIIGHIASLLEEALGAEFEEFDEDSRFIDLGLDSLLMTQLARTLRTRLGFEATFRQLSEQFPTPRTLAKAVREARTAPQPREGARKTAEAKPEPAQAIAGARLGRDEQGRPAWFIPDPERAGKYKKVVDNG